MVHVFTLLVFEAVLGSETIAIVFFGGELSVVMRDLNQDLEMD